MMKKRYLLTAVAASGMLLMSAGTALAFHGGGVAHCDGCHSMHNSPDNPVSGTPNSTLLKGTDNSSTCLNCHDGAGSYHVNSPDGSNITQGGDFYWITNPYDVNIRGNTVTFGGDNAGHNIVAVDFGLAADVTNTTAPGGTYNSGALTCTSCHDPHGQVLGGTAAGQDPISISGSYGGTPPSGTIAGNYRLLGDSAYKYEPSFSADAPIARSAGFFPDPFGSVTRYASGMSEWCANCHGDYIGDSNKHPVATQLNGLATNYNAYVATGDFTGTQATSYDSLVPFEDLTATTGADLDLSSTAGPVSGAQSQVMCLTCHRAHASAHNNAGRWDFEVEFIAESYVLESGDVPVTAVPYYGDGAAIDVVAKYGEYQRSLCNKCHVQD